MKNIFVKYNTLKEAVDYINGEITFFGFLSHVKFFLKELLINPLYADVDDYLKKNGIDRKSLINILIKRNIIIKETKINNINNKDNFTVSYKIPKHNFERKMRRLFSFLFNNNNLTNLSEDGATSCGSAMQGGGMNPDAGQYTKPMGMQRRKIYITNKQSDFIKETTTSTIGNYQYDKPLCFNNNNDITYNHKNIISNKKKGIRRKQK